MPARLLSFRRERARRRSLFAAIAFVAIGVALGLPAAASAAAPNVDIPAYPTETGDTTATLVGHINPEGEATTYWVEYDLASSEWCSSGNLSGSPANETAPVDLGFTDDTSHAVSVDLTGLTPQSEQCAMIVATNADGQGESGLNIWWQTRPEVDTSGAVATGLTTATVEGDINPENQPAWYQALYAPASSEWCASSGASGSPSATNLVELTEWDPTLHHVSVDLTGLTTGVEYCAELYATNRALDASGSQVTWSESYPDAVTYDAYSATSTTVTVEGFVNAGGDATTTYQVQYDQASSNWCTSSGDSGMPANTTDPTASGLDTSSTTYQYVAVDLPPLTEGTDYCAQLITTNDNGQAEGGQVWWTQGAPTTDTYTVDPSGATAVIGGDVNPAGADTTYQVDYDLQSSDWCQTGFGSAAYSTPPQDLGSIVGTFHDVSVNLSGLTLGADYCADVVATNTDGTYESFPVYWTQPPPNYTMTVTVNGPGSGTVTSSPAGIECGSGGSACSASFAEGTQVTLTATPSAGSVLLEGGWLGCTPPSPGNLDACVYTISGSTNVTLQFWPSAPLGQTVNVQLAGTGSGAITSEPSGIDCGSICSYKFSSSDTVTLSASAASGSKLGSWSGPCRYTPRLTDACTLSASDSTSDVTATFDKVPPAKRPKCSLQVSPRVPLRGPAMGKMTLGLDCTQSVSYSITGKFTIMQRRGTKTRKSTATVRIRGRIPSATWKKLNLRLPMTALKALETHASESVRFRLSATDANGSSSVKHTVKHLE